MIVSLVIPGEPAVKERPRCTGRGARSTERQIAAEGRIARLLQAKYIVAEPYLGPVWVDVVFYTRAALKDTDNMLKLCLDAMNGGVLYGDDSQVVGVRARKMLCGKDEARTELEITLDGGDVMERALVAREGG